MDIELEKRIKEAVEVLQQLSAEPINFHEMDPIAKMMLVAMVGEIQKVLDYVDDVNQRLVERFCTDFIPRQKVDAMPAICLLHPMLKARGDNGLLSITGDASFAYKHEGLKQPLTYIPIFNTSLIPNSGLYLLNHHELHDDDTIVKVNMDGANQLWIGIKTASEVNCLRGLSMLIKGTNGIMPEHIYAGVDNEELDFATMLEMESIEMVEPSPSAEPKRGKWIEDKGQQTLMQNFIERGEVWRVCSVCGAGHMIGHKYECDKAYHETQHNFCPNCGADMRGEQDG